MQQKIKTIGIWKVSPCYCGLEWLGPGLRLLANCSFSFGEENWNPAAKYLLKPYRVVSARVMEMGEARSGGQWRRLRKIPSSGLATQVGHWLQSLCWAAFQEGGELKQLQSQSRPVQEGHCPRGHSLQEGLQQLVGLCLGDLWAVQGVGPECLRGGLWGTWVRPRSGGRCRECWLARWPRTWSPLWRKEEGGREGATGKRSRVVPGAFARERPAGESTGSEKGQQQAECKFELTGAISELDTTDLKEKIRQRRRKEPGDDIIQAENSWRPRADRRTSTCVCIRAPSPSAMGKLKHNNNKTPLHWAKEASGKGHMLLWLQSTHSPE